MSKLIIEMEMPHSCFDCPCHNGEDGYYCQVDKYHRYIYNDIPSWCPIKGVLPDEHGDLIDIDVAIQTFKCIEEAPYSGFDGQEAFYTPEDVVNTLLCQDVVIAAERKET